MLVPQNQCVWNLKLPDVGDCVRWLATGMSTRLWTIQYRMVNRAFAQGSQPIRSSIAEKHYWYRRLLPGLSPLCGPISYLIIQGWIISWVFGASYAGGKHRLEHVDTTMYFHGAIRQCTCNWQWKLLLVWLTVIRVGDIHWRFIAGDTQQLAR